jgi:hypothetical protein
MPIVFDNERTEALVEGMPERNIFDERLFARIKFCILFKIERFSVVTGVFIPEAGYKIREYSRVSFLGRTEKDLKNEG